MSALRINQSSVTSSLAVGVRIQSVDHKDSEVLICHYNWLSCFGDIALRDEKFVPQALSGAAFPHPGG